MPPPGQSETEYLLAHDSPGFGRPSATWIRVAQLGRRCRPACPAPDSRFFWVPSITGLLSRSMPSCCLSVGQLVPSFGVAVIRWWCLTKFRFPQYWMIRVQNLAIMRTLIGQFYGPSGRWFLTPSGVVTNGRRRPTHVSLSGASKYRPQDPTNRMQ